WDSQSRPDVIQAGIEPGTFLSLLNTYNCFLKDKSQQHLVFYERGGDVVFEGFLNISWGVRQPIRLKIQDDKQQPFTSLLSPDPVSPISPHGGKRGMTRWGEFEDLHQINETEETNKQDPAEETNNHTADQLSVKKGFYFLCLTAIFTPSYGTSTNVRINSKMTTHQVISQLLQKFKIENDPNEFALYCVHQSGEKKKLSDSDMPLWERLLRGPAENIMKMFLMDRDEEEVSNDVAQYLNLELPILEGVLVKLEEEENRELQRITTKLHQHPPGYSRKYIHY
uniref:Ras association domain family member 6 n=1 Tax=Hucho hucho TaxID=62062 RepID=A0A4W5JW04_9TELE